MKKIYVLIIVVCILFAMSGAVICFRNHEKMNSVQLENSAFNIEDIKSKQMEDIKIEQFSAGADEFGRALILAPDGYVYEWLGDKNGQLLKIEELENIKQVEVGGGFMYALGEKGALYRRDVKVDRNIKSKCFKIFYSDPDIKRIDFHSGSWIIKENNLQYVFNEMDRIGVSDTYTFNEIVDICSIDAIDYVLDKDGILWRLNNRKSDKPKPEKISENICKVMSRGNELIAIDGEGSQISWRQNKEGEFFNEERQEAYKEYTKEIVMEDDYLFTTGGHLYDLSYGMSEVILKDKVVYYNNRIFLTAAGDVYYTEDGNNHTFIMNIYDIKEDNAETIPEKQEYVCAPNPVQGLIANTDSYLMYIDEAHTLYEYRDRRVRRRVDIKDVSAVAISNDRNYVIDRNGNAYAEKRENNIAFGFERLDIGNVKAMKTSAYSDIVVFMREDQIVILDDGKGCQYYDIQYNEIADICIFYDCIIFLKKDGTLWVSDGVGQCKGHLKVREIALNIKYIETNAWYLLGVDKDGIGYFWHDNDFEEYEKSRGFENTKMTSKEYCVDHDGHVGDMDSENLYIVFNEGNVIYLANGFFMTETGDLYKISISELGKRQIEFLFNTKECEKIPDKKVGHTTYDLNNKTSVEHVCKYEIQECSEVNGSLYCEEYSDGNILNKLGEGEEVIGKYSEGLASVKVDNKIGFIDEEGNMVIAPQFESSVFRKASYVFSDGLCRVEKDGKMGMIDTTGKMVIPNVYDYLDDFSEGLARFFIDSQKWGFMNRDGDYVFEPIFDYAYSFSHDLAFVKISRFSEESVDDNWYIINTEGKFLNTVFDGQMSLMPVSDGVFGFIDEEGIAGFMDIYGDILYRDAEKKGAFNFVYFDENVVGICTEEKLYVYKVLES